MREERSLTGNMWELLVWKKLLLNNQKVIVWEIEKCFPMTVS